MKVQGNLLSWIVVKDFKEAVKFYTETVGLTLKSQNPEYGWAELSGPEGAFYKEKGAKLVGEIGEVPGHVKMQTFLDPDGNMMQIVQELN